MAAPTSLTESIYWSQLWNAIDNGHNDLSYKIDILVELLENPSSAECFTDITTLQWTN